MDTTGPVPFMTGADKASQTPAYSVALRDALNKGALCTLAQGVVNESDSTPPMVRRNASITVLQARVNRRANAGAGNTLLTIPLGFRPSRQVFIPALKDIGGAVVFLQIDPATGAVTTPFESSANQYIITASFSNQEP